jgi:hypothetical protein
MRRIDEGMGRFMDDPGIRTGIVQTKRIGRVIVTPITIDCYLNHQLGISLTVHDHLCQIVVHERSDVDISEPEPDPGSCACCQDVPDL